MTALPVKRKKEIWRDIPGFEGRYAVSNLGNVKSLSFDQRCKCNGVWGTRKTKERPLSKNKINSGYHVVHLYLDKVRTAVLVHRVVIETFIGHIVHKMTVDHKNGVKTDNRLENLEVVTYSENHDRAVTLGLNKRAQKVRATCVTTGVKREFPSIAQAAMQTAGRRELESSIRDCVRGRSKTAYGCRWEAIE